MTIEPADDHNAVANQRTVSEEILSQALDDLLEAAAAARASLAAQSRAERAGLLHACASALEEAAETLIPLAATETGLDTQRLRGEHSRAVAQFRLFSEALDDDTLMGVVRAAADPDAAPAPTPELCRTTRPIGAVLVFTASNFPFAFGVAGTDTASVLAAGCPVIVKAHPAHPVLSRAIGHVILTALQRTSAPPGTFALIYGRDAGVAALTDPRVSACAFTGSLRGGRALYDLAVSRSTPIPFYGELGSVNPVVVTAAAALARAEEIASGFLGSFALGNGQFCTKPGLLFWPAAHPLPKQLADTITSTPAKRMLSTDIQVAFNNELAKLSAVPGIDVLAAGHPATDGQTTAFPTLLHTTAENARNNPDLLRTEAFGPAALVITYRHHDDLLACIHTIEASLTGTIHAEFSTDYDSIKPVVEALAARAGRLIWNGWPTGLAVNRAQHHGGPYPASTAPLHTSVGSYAITRFLRPIVFQNFPTAMLPTEFTAPVDGGQYSAD